MNRILPRLSAEQRTAFIAAARSFRDVPFKRRGRSFRGVDCVGLPVCALAMIGLSANDLRVYSPRPDGVTLRATLVAHLGPPIPVPDAQPGDIALMRWHESNGTVWHNHVGIFTPYHLGGLSLLHAFKPAGRVIEHNIESPWDRRIAEVFSLGGDA